MWFNGIDFSKYVVVEHIRRKFLPPIEMTTTPIAGRDGDLLVGKRLTPNIIEVDIRLIEEDLVDMREKARVVAGLLYTRKDAKLELRDEPTLYNMASIEGGSDLETYLGIGLTTVNFVCHDPIAYSRELTEKSLANPIEYKGTEPSGFIAKIVVSEDTDALELRNMRTGDFVKIEVELKKNEIITFDFYEEKITRNGVSLMKYLLYESDFFNIDRETTTIKVTGGTGTIEYRERWI